MERLRRLTKQLLIAPTAGADTGAAAGEAHDDSLPQSQKNPPKLTPEQQARIMQVFMEYVESGTKLVNEGVLPTLTTFDMLMATEHNFGVTATADATNMLREAEAKGGLGVFELLPGPWRDAHTEQQRVEAVQQVQRAVVKGFDIFQYVHWQLHYGDRGLSSNIAVPFICNVGYGSNMERRFTARVILADPEDAERISRTHVRKEGNFEHVIFDSVLSTTDNDWWKEQRRNLSEVFLPLSSLAEILPVSLARARLCADRLQSATAGGAAVDISDFLLHEAQAQLQLALLGAPQELMEATNSDIRATFMGDLESGRVGALSEAMRSIMQAAREDTTLALPTDGCPVRGPLARAVQRSGLPASAAYGNMLLILFAGHDTTGHTMTWLLFEAARRPEVQRRLHEEVDAFFAALGGREPAYRDFGSGQLDFLDRCITETLRMWPAVASGTYRQLQFDDVVRGPGGATVTLPRGTPVNIVNWPRHRNPALWGADVDDFNPDRDFGPEEMARVGCPMAARNPQSQRFSPFAHAPRNCLGRNFAQMEMRLILTQLLRRFEFSLAPPYDRLAGAKLGVAPKEDEFHGINRATMGPMDLERSTEHFWGTRHLYALKVHAKLRV